MSPAAAEFASACKAPGPDADVVAPPDVAVLAVVCNAARPCPPEPPHPGSAPSAANATKLRRSFISPVSGSAPEPLLNGERAVDRDQARAGAATFAGVRSRAMTVVTGRPRCATRCGKST